MERNLPDNECLLAITTAAVGFGEVWGAVVTDFVERHSPGGLQISINDGGARPDTVSLRLAQGVRLIEEDDAMNAASSWYEASARQRVRLLLDPGSFASSSARSSAR